MLDHRGEMQPDSHLCQIARQRADVLFSKPTFLSVVSGEESYE
jgi:hypothetical protein